MFRACVGKPQWHLVPPTRDVGDILEIHRQYRGGVRTHYYTSTEAVARLCLWRHVTLGF
jgi:hypothetical protein